MSCLPDKLSLSSPASFERQRKVREGGPGFYHRDSVEHLGSLPLAKLTFRLAGNDTWEGGENEKLLPRRVN